MLSRFHFGERFLPAILLQRGTNCFLRTGDDQLLFTSLGHDTQTNQSPVTCRASQAAQAPTDPLYSPPLTAPHPLQTPLTTGDQPQALRLPKDLPGQRVEPPRVAPRPHPVNMKGHLHQRGRPPYTLRDTRWVSVVHEVSSPFNAMHPKPSSVSTFCDLFSLQAAGGPQQTPGTPETVSRKDNQPVSKSTWVARNHRDHV